MPWILDPAYTSCDRDEDSAEHRYTAPDPCLVEVTEAQHQRRRYPRLIGRGRVHR